ncbi:MAG: sensor histidine kinase [Bacteroidales bacterium]|nr:sensor histidine kinase [Bacteroidales bacterium]
MKKLHIMKIGLNILLVWSICTFAKVSAVGQTVNIDSLNALIKNKNFRSISEELKVLDKICNKYIESDLPRAEKIAIDMLNLASKSKEFEFESIANENVGRILYMQGRIDSSILFLKRAIDGFNAIPNSEKEQIESKTYLANAYRVSAKYDESIELYNQALKYYESKDDKIWTAKVLANIGSLYYTAGNQAKGEEYTLKALEMQRKSKDVQGEVISLVNLTVFALNNGNYQQGIKYGDEALSKLKNTNRTYYASALIRVGYCYYRTGNKTKAIEYTNEAIKIQKENKNISGMLESYRVLGDYYYETKDYTLAKKTGLEALQYADTSNRLDLRLLYDLLKRASIFLNQHEDAIDYSQKQINMKEADLNKDWASKIAEADAKYQTEKKDREIERLKTSQKIRLIVIISLGLLLIVGFFATFFFARSLRQKRKIAEQKILQLEQEKQLIATQSLLEGETIERVRLSKDLHDGLGGLLSVTKHKIANMKGNLTIPADQVEIFNSALEMLDNSIVELRRVAHNLMPESLVRYGLNSAINDFCSSIDKVNYYFYGTEKRLDEKLEVAAFRIINELVNNALKHAHASKINVQLVQEQERISITVYDDGRGFNPKSIDHSKPGGLNNIESRVLSFNGRMDLFSTPEKGTEISVEFKL